MKTIPLTRGKVALIDDADYKLISLYKWRYMNDGYAMGYVNKKNIAMHNFILGVKGIDHKNRDRLDNRRENLRFATRSQNQCNRGKESGKSRFKGVSLHQSGKWQAVVNGKYIGLFKTEISAAKAYDEQAVRLFGEFALTNKDMGKL